MNRNQALLKAAAYMTHMLDKNMVCASNDIVNEVSRCDIKDESSSITLTTDKSFSSGNISLSSNVPYTE
jgi:hypothetical protein